MEDYMKNFERAKLQNARCDAIFNGGGGAFH